MHVKVALVGLALVLLLLAAPSSTQAQTQADAQARAVAPELQFVHHVHYYDAGGNRPLPHVTLRDVQDVARQ
ncbi:MAG: hypothetical protein WD740_04480, partial [Anaerolineales bacterium]